MKEKEIEQQGQTTAPSKEKDDITVKWRTSGREPEELNTKKGTKLSGALHKKGHENLMGKKLFLNGNLVSTDEKGNLKEDPELQEGDMLSLFEAQITKGM